MTRVDCEMPLKNFFAVATRVSAAFVAAVATSVALQLVVTCPANSKETAPMWVLNQREEDCGDFLVYLWRDGVSVTVKKMDCHVVTCAPDWKVHCFRNSEKIEWVGEMAQFSGVVMANPFALPKMADASNLQLQGKIKYNGINCSKYVDRRFSQNLLFTASDISVSPRVGDFLARLYYIPNKDGVPLYKCLDKGRGHSVKSIQNIGLDASNDLRGGLSIKLQTLSCRTEPYDARYFQLPKNFKRVSDVVRVTYSPNKRDQFVEIFDNVGFRTGNKPAR